LAATIRGNQLVPHLAWQQHRKQGEYSSCNASCDHGAYLVRADEGWRLLLNVHGHWLELWLVQLVQR